MSRILLMVYVSTKTNVSLATHNGYSLAMKWILQPDACYVTYRIFPTEGENANRIMTIQFGTVRFNFFYFRIPHVIQMGNNNFLPDISWCIGGMVVASVKKERKMVNCTNSIMPLIMTIIHIRQLEPKTFDSSKQKRQALCYHDLIHCTWNCF